MQDLGQLTIEDFQTRLDQTFLTHVSGQEIRMVLTKCESKLRHPAERSESSRREPFSLTFVAKDQPQLDQGNYTLQSESFELTLFIVPIAVGTYQAIFS